MNQPISRLFTIAFAWAYKIGAWKNELMPIKIKMHQRKSVPFFRYGLDVMREEALKQVSTLFKMDLLNYRVWEKLERTERD